VGSSHPGGAVESIRARSTAAGADGWLDPQNVDCGRFLAGALSFTFPSAFARRGEVAGRHRHQRPQGSRDAAGGPASPVFRETDAPRRRRRQVRAERAAPPDKRDGMLLGEEREPVGQRPAASRGSGWPNRSQPPGGPEQSASRRATNPPQDDIGPRPDDVSQRPRCGKSDGRGKEGPGGPATAGERAECGGDGDEEAAGGGV